MSDDSDSPMKVISQKFLDKSLTFVDSKLDCSSKDMTQEIVLTGTEKNWKGLCMKTLILNWRRLLIPKDW